MTDPRYWIWLSLGFSPGSAACDTLMQRFSYNAKAIFDADPIIIKNVLGDSKSVKILNDTRNFSRVDRIFELCQRENIGLLTPDSKYYPSSLLRITGQPPVIYYKGRIPELSSRPCIGVVGTRRVTPYGRSASYTISHDLASAGAVVVSGMALGTDTAAHRGALDARGFTVAILGCGLDIVYPRENEALMREIESYGAVMTDYAPGERPEGWHFPLRNRLISGISHGVLVVEADVRSGAMITADHARKQGKLIYAVPGKVGELASTGTNDLIRRGAKMVTSSFDILSDFRGLFSNGFNADYPHRAHGVEPRQMQAAEPSPNIHFPNIHQADAVRQTPVYERTADKDNPTHMKTSVSYSGSEIPEGGYEVTLTDDKISSLRSLSNSIGNRYSIADDTLYDHVTALKAMRKSRVITPPEYKSVNERKKAPDTAVPEIPAEKTGSPEPPDVSGLSETEAKILLFLSENGKSLVDSMASLGIPVSQLLATLTLLEIKQRVIQTPGGYFSLK